jgi:hypothetical protein
MPSCLTHVQKFGPSLPFEGKFNSAVSLHSHTMYSREYLKRLPSYIRRIPIVHLIVEWEIGRLLLYKNHCVDFRRVYWTPPLSAREALALEQQQIQKQLGLRALVSLTDHDTVEAGLHLRMLGPSSDVPVSVEWSMPYGKTVFHFGVHNLPAVHAADWMAQFANVTANPSEERLCELLRSLNDDPSVLLILNHPYWDAESVGPEAHRKSLADFLTKYSSLIHGLEVNGMRSRRENREVLKLGEETNLPVISGGDRHGCEPNATLNLTQAESFDDFVVEIRQEHRSNLLLMPQFFEALQARLLESAWHAMSDAPGEFGRQHWMSRVFYEDRDGAPRPISEFMGTKFHVKVDRCRWIMALLASPQVRPALRLAFLGNEEGGL